MPWMSVRSHLRLVNPLVGALLFSGALLLATGCGGNTAGITVGAMPDGGSFHGAWMSPEYGDMHLCQIGRVVRGDYNKNERHGTIQGRIEGDILWFRWEEERTLVPGRPTIATGQGYFRVSFNADEDLIIEGEWGFEQDRRGGGAWTGIKRRRTRPSRCAGSSETAPSQPQVSWDEEEEDDTSGGDAGEN